MTVHQIGCIKKQPTWKRATSGRVGGRLKLCWTNDSEIVDDGQQLYLRILVLDVLIVAMDGHSIRDASQRMALLNTFG